MSAHKMTISRIKRLKERIVVLLMFVLKFVCRILYENVFNRKKKFLKYLCYDKRIII